MSPQKRYVKSLKINSNLIVMVVDVQSTTFKSSLKRGNFYILNNLFVFFDGDLHISTTKTYCKSGTEGFITFLQCSIRVIFSKVRKKFNNIFQKCEESGAVLFVIKQGLLSKYKKGTACCHTPAYNAI